MINAPIKFADGKVTIGLSTRADGNMRNPALVSSNADAVMRNRQKFLKRLDLSLDATALVCLDYSVEDFTKYSVTSSADDYRLSLPDRSITSNDGLATQAAGVGLFLPLADCLGAVIFDPEKNALMVSHLGRHNLEQNGGQKSVEFLINKFHSRPENLLVWLSPSAGKSNYPLFSFDNKSIREVAIEQLTKAGVKAANISGEDIDTTTDPNYFSHSMALKEGTESERFAIVAKLI